MVNATSPTANFNRVEVRGGFVGWDGSPVAGTLTFLPRAARATDLAALKTIVRRPITATLSPTGMFSVLLPATDDPDINVTFTYQVTENFPGGETYDITVPVASEPAGIDITSLARTYPVDPITGAFPSAVPDASTAIKGIVELATNLETTTGTDTIRAVTPAGVKAALNAVVTPAPAAASTTVAGIVELATNLETTTGTDTVRATTPAGVKAALDAVVTPAPAAASTTIAGIVELATNLETTTGTDTVRAVTPAGVKAVADTKSATSHAHAFSELSGTADITDLPPGVMLYAAYNAVRPTSRTDLAVTFVGGTDATPPLNGIAGVDLWVKDYVG